MSRKHSLPSSASIDNIDGGIFTDDVDTLATQNPAKRKKANDSRSILLEQVQDRKTSLFRDYQIIIEQHKQADEAWQWLSGLGIPCHNIPIPVTPHTKPHLSKGTRSAADALKSVNLKEVYHAHDVTRSILSRYCDWKISDELPRLPIIDSATAHSAFYTCRNAARNAAFSGPSRPGYEERPTRRDPEISIDRCVLRVIRSAAVQFQNPTLRIPLEWKTVPEPTFFSLPALYSKMLAEIKANGGKIPKGETAGSFVREPSRPLDDIAESHLFDLLKRNNAGDVPPSESEKKKLDLFQEYLPVDNTVVRDIAYQNAQQAEGIVDALNHPLSLIDSRRQVASKLDSALFTESQAVSFISKKKILEFDDFLGFGSILFNDGPSILCHHTAAIALKWANETGSPAGVTELGDERTVGGLLNKLFINEETYISDGGALSLPGCLQMAAMEPKPDFFSQAQEIPSSPRLQIVSPVIFAGECKKIQALTPHTPAQLACALNGTLVLLVLMYLDMRDSTEDPLPEWLFVYGIIYTGSGVIIRAHFPTYRYSDEESDIDTDKEDDSMTVKDAKPARRKGPAKRNDGTRKNKAAGLPRDEIPNHQDEVKLNAQKQQAVNHGRPRWIFRSVEVTKRYSKAFESQSSSERIRLLATMLMIQSHSFLLLEKFKAWAKESSPRSAFDDFLFVLGPD